MHSLLRLMLLATFACAGIAFALCVALHSEPPRKQIRPQRLVSERSAGVRKPSDKPLETESTAAVLAAADNAELESPSPATRSLSEAGLFVPPPLPVAYHPAADSQFTSLQQQLDLVRGAVEQNQRSLTDELSALRAQVALRAEATAKADDGAHELPAPVSDEAPTAASRTARPGLRTVSTKPPEIRAGEGDNRLVVNIQNSDIREVLELLGQQGELNILASKNVTGNVSASLNGVDVQTALAAILKSAGFVSRRDGNFIFVGTPDDFREMDHTEQQIITRVYRPNYVTATELQTLITPLLTKNVGNATVSAGTIAKSSPATRGIAASSDEAGGDDFAGGDVLLVRDYESVLQEVDLIVVQVDQRPLQVAIESMILSVKLDDTNEFGVDFEALRDKNNARLISGSPLNSLAAIDVTERGLKFGFLDSSLAVFVNALESIGDTDVVASPRLMCLNKQRAEILIGSQLGYVSTTVTETAATQAVEFLEVGTQLRFRPFISSDGIIRLEVHPELSTGNVRVEDGLTLPDKEVTQVTTNIMCPDGCTVIIGGLIREDLSTTTTQIPLVGSLPILGPAFRQKTETMDRRELIVVITPRIVGDHSMCREGAEAGAEFQQRQSVYTDKMSPIGQRYIGRRFLRLGQAALAAGDLQRAMRYANLAIEYDRQNLDAIRLRNQVVAQAPASNGTVRSYLHEGLLPWQHPLRDYSRQGYPYQVPGPGVDVPPVFQLHDGSPLPAEVPLEELEELEEPTELVAPIVSPEQAGR